MNIADLAPSSPRLYAAVLLDTRDVVGTDGRVAEDVPCMQCGYNQRSLPADGRCPECGHDVATTLRERTGTRPVRLWLYDAGGGLALVGWGVICLTVPPAAAVVQLALIPNGSSAGGFLQTLTALAFVLAAVFLLPGTGCAGWSPPAAIRRHLPFHRLASVSLLVLLPSAALLVAGGIVTSGLPGWRLSALLLGLLGLLVFPGLHALHLHTLVRLAGPKTAARCVWLAYALAVLVVTTPVVMADVEGSRDALGAAVAVVATVGLLLYGYALLRTARVLTTAAGTLPVPEPASEPAP
jgi:hypothetical protein